MTFWNFFRSGLVIGVIVTVIALALNWTAVTLFGRPGLILSAALALLIGGCVNAWINMHAYGKHHPKEPVLSGPALVKSQYCWDPQSGDWIETCPNKDCLRWWLMPHERPGDCAVSGMEHPDFSKCTCAGGSAGRVNLFGCPVHTADAPMPDVHIGSNA